MNGILIAGNGYDMLKAYYAILRALYKYSWYFDNGAFCDLLKQYKLIKMGTENLSKTLWDWYFLWGIISWLPEIIDVYVFDFMPKENKN